MYSYRGLWLPWRATPEQRPAVAVGRERRRGGTVLYASWNGATGVAGWLLQAGSRHDQLRPVGIAKRRGFETAIPLRAQPRFASLIAVDRRGTPLSRSPLLQL
jgi:hypothetical protein